MRRHAFALLAVFLALFSITNAQGPTALPEKEPILDLGRMAAIVFGFSPDLPPQGDTSVIDTLVIVSAPVWSGKFGSSEATARTAIQPAFTQWATAKANQASAGNIVPLNMLEVMSVPFDDVSNGGSCLSWMADASATGGYNLVMNELRRIGADHATCITNGSDNCGVGYLFITANGTPFSSSHWDGCSVPNFSLIHEVGHNHGLNHEPQSACSAPTCSGSNYGFGWGGPASGQSVERDPMTYPREGGSRVLWWSSPLFTRIINTVSYVIGTADHNDNLKQLIAYGPTIAGFRARAGTFPVPRPPGKTAALTGQSFVTISLSPDDQAVFNNQSIVQGYNVAFARVSDGVVTDTRNCGKPQNGNCTIPLTVPGTVLYTATATAFGPGGTSAGGPASNPFTKTAPTSIPVNYKR